MIDDWEAYRKMRREERARIAAYRQRERFNAGYSQTHCGIIRRLPCLGCGRDPAGTIHHLKEGEAAKHRGIGKRAPDRLGVPLCWDSPESCHPSVERALGHEIEWFAERGIIAPPEKIAGELWAAFREFTGDYRYQRMRLIIMTHREGFEI